RPRRDRCVRAAPTPGPSRSAGRAAQWPTSRGVLDLASSCRGLVLAAATTGPSPTSPGRAALGVCHPVPLRHPGLVAARVGGAARAPRSSLADGVGTSPRDDDSPPPVEHLVAGAVGIRGRRVVENPLARGCPATCPRGDAPAGGRAIPGADV